jgi:hypothetical protein
LGHLVNSHDDEQLGVSVRFDDYDPRALQVSDVDHESALHDIGLEHRGLF